jgi:hypothetical protein
MIMNLNRSALRTRPLNQRAIIRSWEYIKPLRITVLAIRLLVSLWLVVLTGILVSNGFVWGWALLAAAAAVAAIGLWVFNTAEKGWPAVKA